MEILPIFLANIPCQSMLSETLPTICQNCGKTLRGRSDKKFCDDACRNTFNNRLKGKANNLVRNVNNALSKNRRVLEQLLPDEQETISVSKEKMIRLGFDFKYLTHFYTTRTGKTYYYCYDYGYLPLENEWYLIVRKRES